MDLLFDNIGCLVFPRSLIFSQACSSGPSGKNVGLWAQISHHWSRPHSTGVDECITLNRSKYQNVSDINLIFAEKIHKNKRAGFSVAPQKTMQTKHQSFVVSPINFFCVSAHAELASTEKATRGQK